MDYLVSWEIDIEADSPEEAAQEAKKILQTQIGPVVDVVDDRGYKTRIDFLESVEESIKAAQLFRAEPANLSKGANSDDGNSQGHERQALVDLQQSTPDQEGAEEARYPICPECLHTLDSIDELAECSGCGTRFNSSISELLHLLREDIFTYAWEFADRVRRIRELALGGRATHTISP